MALDFILELTRRTTPLIYTLLREPFMRSARTNRKLNRIHTPLGIDQLEARMLCAVDTISELLNSLNDSPTPPSLNATEISGNKAPTVAKQIAISNPTQAIVRSVNLSVLGSDDRGEAALKYTWSVSSTTQGATGTFSVNGSNASKNTTLTFNRAGTYEVRAYITDAGRLSVVSTLRVTVAQVLTSIQVTPGTSGVATGRTQQLTAQGLDQFQQPLVRQPAFNWSTSSGSINQSGLFTAPRTATIATITARSGTLSATARVSVTASTPTPTPTPNPTPSPSPNAGLSNAALSNLVNTYFADGSINRTEMIQLLRSAGSDGTVDSSELNDFRYIVSNATRYNIPNYVQVLASNIVNTNPANGLFQGQAAGNLAAGASATQLNNLVEKWFLGSDLPTLTSSSLSYQVVSGSLFNGTPSRDNMKQGQLGDCYFIASLGSIANSNPTAVSNMFVDNSDGTFTVRFYASNGVADYVTVNRRLPTYNSSVLAYSGMGSQISSAANTLWIALAEKAYAQWNATGKSGRNGTNTYASIEGGWMGAVNAQVLGYGSNNYSFDSNGQTALIAALGSNKAVTLGTNSNALAGGLVGGHAYVVAGYNSSTQTFTLANPWGASNPTPLTWSQLQTNCSMFVVANPSVTTPIVSGGGIANVRSEADATSFSFVVTVSSNANDPLLRNGSESQTEFSSDRDRDVASSSSNVASQSFELSESDFDDIAGAYRDDRSSADKIDFVLSSLMDAILELDNLDQVLA